MTGRSAGFYPKEAVASILSALRERNGASETAPNRPKPVRREEAAAPATLVADLADGYALYAISDTQSGIDTETRTWMSDLDRLPSGLRSTSPGRTVFSLRDPRGECMALIVAQGTPATVTSIIQPRSRPEAIPASGPIARALLSTGVELGQYAQRLGALRDSEDRLHFIDSAPDKLDLSADFCGYIADPVIMPKVLSSDADFLIVDSLIGRNPVSVNVKGHLSFVNVRGLVLPTLLNVGRDLLLQLSDARALPSRFSVGRDLNIGLTAISEFPDQFYVGRHIVANGAAISRLRGGFTLKGNLDLRGCPISELPWGLDIGGSLDLSGTRVTQIPGDAVIGGNLMVEDTVVVPPTVRLGGRLMYARPYGYETVQRPAH
jgi:hypothetical protein|nr:hypothetical protein [Neorhizobium tomejilense]